MNTFNIYRKDELEFPEFKSLEEARVFFETSYKGNYVRGGCERLSDDVVCYFDELNYQPVQISVYDDGYISVHVVY